MQPLGRIRDGGEARAAAEGDSQTGDSAPRTHPQDVGQETIPAGAAWARWRTGTGAPQAERVRPPAAGEAEAAAQLRGERAADAQLHGAGGAAGGQDRRGAARVARAPA